MENQQNQESEWLSINHLAKQTGAGRRHIKPWLDAENVPTKKGRNGTLYDAGQALEIIAMHQRHQPPPGAPELDPETGLTWYQSKLREDVLRSRDEREREKQLAGGDLIPARVVEDAAQMAAGKFRSLASQLYILGIPGVRVGGEWESRVERLGVEFAQDFTDYMRQWIEREAQIMKANSKKAESPRVAAACFRPRLCAVQQRLAAWGGEAPGRNGRRYDGALG